MQSERRPLNPSWRNMGTEKDAHYCCYSLYRSWKLIWCWFGHMSVIKVFKLANIGPWSWFEASVKYGKATTCYVAITLWNLWKARAKGFVRSTFLNGCRCTTNESWVFSPRAARFDAAETINQVTYIGIKLNKLGNHSCVPISIECTHEFIGGIALLWHKLSITKPISPFRVVREGQRSMSSTKNTTHMVQWYYC